MKINEVDYDIGFSSDEKSVKNSPWDVYSDDDIKNDRSLAYPAPSRKKSYIGSGISGAAYGLKDQQSITRIAYRNLRPGDRDPYQKFIKIAIENQGNPFVPKLYNIKKFVAPMKKNSFAGYDNYYSRNFYYVTMEKLTSVEELSIGQILSSYNLCFQSAGDMFTLDKISKGIFHDEEFDILGSTCQELGKLGFVSDRQHEFLRNLTQGLATLIEYYITTGSFVAGKARLPHLDLMGIQIHNEYLSEIIEIIKSVHLKQSVNMDLHWGNILYRTTPYGAQPVITDPFV